MLSVLAIEVIAEHVEALNKECRKFVNPIDHILQLLWMQAIQPLVAVMAKRGALGLFKDVQTLRDRSELI